MTWLVVSLVGLAYVVGYFAVLPYVTREIEKDDLADPSNPLAVAFICLMWPLWLPVVAVLRAVRRGRR